MNSNNRIAATLYSLGNVCLRNTSINTLHKEMMMKMTIIIMIIIDPYQLIELSTATHHYTTAIPN